ncbi:Transposase IS4 family protein [Streptomyces sparsogenes DSM 40356]|uniref:Transposase IS4 family protein n=1 Tax=Streptomyces sparsogenes DSM 40356 TaxID=1331668 RepID=A0A1R1SC98_9ACTN|nr:Transposase IS4 family protein [Streptomyces sparsogenes DSM 40356]
MVTPADLHDSAAINEVLFRLRLLHPQITIVWADTAYAGKLVDWAEQHLNLTVKPVSRPMDASGFIVLSRRWVVERSLAWLRHARRHARDYERLVQHEETLITWPRSPHGQETRPERRHLQLAKETGTSQHLTASIMPSMGPLPIQTITRCPVSGLLG